MHSDQFVPIWTIAGMENIKALTSDVDLIRELLQGTGWCFFKFVRTADL